MTAVTIPQSRPPREHTSARLWWLATASPAVEATNGSNSGCPGNNGGPHNYMPTRDAYGKRVWACTRCPSQKR